MNRFIDIGANLTHKSLMQDIQGVMSRAAANAVNKMVVTGTSLAETEAAIALCENYNDKLVCTAGIHPHHANEWDDDTGDRLALLAKKHCVRAIGETGLDFNRNFSPRDDQISAFQQQLSLASSLSKPVFSHQRDAHDCFVDVLRQFRDRLEQIVVHCFTDNQAALEDYLDLDCHIGITGWICDERRGLELQQLVKYIPANRLMIETDSPYLLPRDLRPKPKSRINEPANLPHILRKIADLRPESADELAASCLQTTETFFNI